MSRSGANQAGSAMEQGPAPYKDDERRNKDGKKAAYEPEGLWIKHCLYFIACAAFEPTQKPASFDSWCLLIN